MVHANLLTLPAASSSRWSDFERLVQTHQRALYHFALRLTGQEQDAEDLLQESLLRAFKSFDRFAPGTAFDRWVYRIIYHLFVDGYRHRKRANLQVASLDAPIMMDENEMKREIPDSEAGPEDLAMTAEFHQVLKTALDELQSEFRAAVVLCDVQGLSYEEIAQIMDCSIGTVRSRIHRGRRQLREKLLPYLHCFQKEADLGDELPKGQ